MSVLDLDYYKLTMLQFIWKHYADVPVTLKLHSRKQHLASIVEPDVLARSMLNYDDEQITKEELDFLRGLEVFEEPFLRDLKLLFDGGLAVPTIESMPNHCEVYVVGDWFRTSLWETVILSAVSEQYSTVNIQEPSLMRTLADIQAISDAGAWWADFGTRRRWSFETQKRTLSTLVDEFWSGYENHMIGTSNVHLAHQLGLTPIGTYAHELEMVLRPYFGSNFGTTRNVLEKWQDLYPWKLRVALTDTYTTPQFFRDHGRFLLDNNWRGVRLDSGDPFDLGNYVDEWLVENRPAHLDPLEVVFSDGLDAKTIVKLQQTFSPEHGRPARFIKPIFGWGTGLTNPNTDLSLVMKAVESNGRSTYKLTDDTEKSIR